MPSCLVGTSCLRKLKNPAESVLVSITIFAYTALAPFAWHIIQRKRVPAEVSTSRNPKMKSRSRTAM
ncbi:hypothetical protein BDZ91DRAFT_444196 [Kalaharituber pfeilii]|nr:hypothetical protein BDZ91DRAFT_444196 [Kalaharituber pfeilii]